MKGRDGDTYRFIGFGMMGRGTPRYRVRRGFPVTVMAHLDRAAVNSLQP
jgi:3-hydroxyisobutyrate dehydrogenase-like beta-hydroxyacid dehydrogenase